MGKYQFVKAWRRGGGKFEEETAWKLKSDPGGLSRVEWESAGREGSRRRCTRQHSPLEELKTSRLAEASSEVGGEVEGN